VSREWGVVFFSTPYLPIPYSPLTQPKAARSPAIRAAI
jgi:hypothetical protein